MAEKRRYTNAKERREDMSVKILEMKQESCPKARFIGRKYEHGANWGEWWENNWFETLEAIQGLPINDNGYIGAVRIINGMPEYWIGMFFPADTEVPEGFEYVDMEPLQYVVFYLHGNEKNGELYTMDTHAMCLEELKAHHLERKENDWCFERYNCPRYTTSDENGNVILDYAVSIVG